jgi:hypothetical protein
VTGLEARLEALVSSSDWLVGGGVLRDLVWDRLHHRAEPSRPRDVDLAFFDPRRLDTGRDAEVERALAARLAGYRGTPRTRPRCTAGTGGSSVPRSRR